jgi:parvulin-like peptidyl-prolyl isomerase
MIVSDVPRCLLIYCFIVIAVLAEGGCGSSNVVVARVGTSVISGVELNHWMSVGGMRLGQAAEGGADRRDRVLGLLIFSRWVIGQANELGVRVSPGEANQQLRLRRFSELEGRPYDKLSRDSRLTGLLSDRRLPEADQLWLMKLGILAWRLERIRVSQARSEVTGSQIATYYREHKSHLLVPETRDLESVMTKRAAGARRAKREIESGKSFLDVARRLNVSPEGGLHVGLVRGAGEPNFEQVVFNARPHVLLGPIEQQLFYVFEVLKITPAHEQTLAEAHEAIRRLLGTRQALRRLTGKIDAIWSARTTCLPAARVRACLTP